MLVWWVVHCLKAFACVFNRHEKYKKMRSLLTRIAATHSFAVCRSNGANSDSTNFTCIPVLPVEPLSPMYPRRPLRPGWTGPEPRTPVPPGGPVPPVQPLGPFSPGTPGKPITPIEPVGPFGPEESAPHSSLLHLHLPMRKGRYTLPVLMGRVDSTELTILWYRGAVYTTRRHGCDFGHTCRCAVFTLHRPSWQTVFTGVKSVVLEHELSTRLSRMMPISTSRVGGQLTRPVNTGTVNRAHVFTESRALLAKSIVRQCYFQHAPR